MRIALLGEGSNVHTRRWVDYFHARGDQVLWLTLEDTPPTGARVERLGRRGRLHALAYTWAWPRARRALEAFSPDLVNAHFIPNYGWMAALAGRRPLALSTWGSDVLVNPRRSPLHLWRARFVLRRADLITSDAEMMSDEIGRLEPRVAPVLTVPMGLERDFYERGRAGDERPPVILHYRNLEPVYDVPTLLRALPAFFERHPEYSARLAGEGSLRGELEALARQLGVADRVSFLGRLDREALVDELLGARLYLSCSLSDSTSVSLLEAMALGAYPVLSDLPANREWLDENGGEFYPAGEPGALSEALERAAARDAGELNRRREANRARVGERALWDENMDRVRRAFGELAGVKP